MSRSRTKPNRLAIWGMGLMNKLRARTRKARKREASKKRRVILKKEDGDTERTDKEIHDEEFVL